MEMIITEQIQCRRSPLINKEKTGFPCKHYDFLRVTLQFSTVDTTLFYSRLRAGATIFYACCPF